MFIFLLFSFLYIIKSLSLFSNSTHNTTHFIPNVSLLTKELDLYQSLQSSLSSHVEHLNSLINKATLLSSNTSVIPLSKNPPKKVTVVQSAMSNKEHLCRLFTINRKNINNFYRYKDSNITLKTFDVKMFICISELSIYLYSIEHKEIAKKEYSLLKGKTINIVNYDTFEEDNNIIVLANESELMIINVAVSIDNTKNENIDIFITLKHSTRINVIAEATPINLIQTKLHGSGYIVVAYDNGDIFVYSNIALQLKNAVTASMIINNVKVINGIIMIIRNNKTTFINLLGGNMILLVCETYNNITDVLYESTNSLLFIVDDAKRIIVYNTKLSIAKPFDNECRVLYRFYLPSYVSSPLSLINSPNDIIVVSYNYIGFIDIAHLSRKGLTMTHYAMISSLSSLSISVSSTFRNFLCLASPFGDVISVEEIREKPKETSSNIIDKINKNKVECNGNILCGILFNTSSNNFYISLITYGIAIAIIMAVVLYVKNNRKREREKEDELNKKNADLGKQMQEMLGKMNQMEKMHGISSQAKKKDYKEDTKEEEDEEIEDNDDADLSDENLMQNYNEYMRQLRENERLNKENVDEDNEDNESN